MNFCNKNVFFSKKYAIFIYVNVSEGSFDLFAQYQAPFLRFNEINWDNRNRKERFWCIRSLFRSLSFQLVKYCRPPIEGDFPFIGVEEFFIPFEKVEKKTDFSVDPFYTLCRGLLEGIKKEPNLCWVLFIPLGAVTKKVQLSLNFFIPPSGFEPLLREWKSRVLGH